MSSNDLQDPLPGSFGPNIKQDEAVKYVKEFLKELLPNTEKDQVEEQENWRFPLERFREDKKRKPKSRKKKFLSRNDRNKLGLLKLPKDGWDYAKVVVMNKMWSQYMYENLELVKRAPHYTDPDYNSFCAVLNKSELIGAEVTIIRSTVPSYVGIKGIIVFETKATFQIVTPNSQFKVIVKGNCVFTLCLNNMKFTIYGKSLLTRPSDRSIKKIKSYTLPDL